MKIYLKNSYTIFMVLFISSATQASLDNEPKAQSNTSNNNIVTRNDNQRSLNTGQDQINPFICVFCCYYATCSCCCPEFCDQKVLPCLEKVASCCKSNEMK